MNQVRLVIVAAFGIACAGVVYSAETGINLGVSEIYSSNILLVPDDEAISDFVTRINPSLTYSKESEFVDLLVDYDFEALIYARNSVLNQNLHQLNANMLARLIGDQLTATADAIYTQVDVDPLKPQTDSNINVTGNRTDGLYLGGGLQWRRKLPLRSEIDASYEFGTIDYDDPGIQGVDTQTLSVSIASDSATTSPLTYELNYNYWYYEYESSGDIKDQNLTLTLSQEISYGLDLLGLVGLDSDFSDPTDPELTEGRWEAGLNVHDDKGHLLVMYGHRYFGNVLRLSAEREVTGLRFSAAYSEEPGTAESVFLEKGPVGVPEEDESPTAPPPVAPPPGTDQPGTGRRFIYKRADGGVSWEGYNSSLGFVVWWDQRDNLSDPGSDALQSNRDESFGAWLGYNLELGVRTVASLWASTTQRTFEDLVEGTNIVFDHKIDTWRIGAGVSYTLGEKTQLSSTLSYLDSSGDGIPDNYDEFQATIELRRSF